MISLTLNIIGSIYTNVKSMCRSYRSSARTLVKLLAYLTTSYSFLVSARFHFSSSRARCKNAYPGKYCYRTYFCRSNMSFCRSNGRGASKSGGAWDLLTLLFMTVADPLRFLPFKARVALQLLQVGASLATRSTTCLFCYLIRLEQRNVILHQVSTPKEII